MKNKLKTLKDLGERDYSTIKEDKGLINSVFFDLRYETIRWIRQDIKDSEDKLLSRKELPEGWTEEERKRWREKALKLPNGKYCYCGPEESCKFHRESKRMMVFNNITEKDLMQNEE